MNLNKDKLQQHLCPFPTGIIGVLQTPFTEAGDVDYLSLTRLVEDCLDHGIDGFLIFGLAGESPLLSEDEKLHIGEHVHETVGDRVPVIWGTGTNDHRDCIRMGNFARQFGAAGYLQAVPTDLYGDRDGIVSFFEKISDEVDFPLMIQDWQPGGDGLDLDTVLELRRRVARFGSLKIETIPAGPKYTQVLQATSGTLHVAGGWAVGQMIEALDRGVHAMIPECSMIRIYKRIDTLYRSGNRDAALELFYRLLPVLSFSNQRLDISIRFFKMLLRRKGIFQTSAVRCETGAFDEHSERIANELIDLVLRIENDIPT